MGLENCLSRLEQENLLTPSRKKKIQEEADRLEKIYTYKQVQNPRQKAELDAAENVIRRAKQEQYALAVEGLKIKELQARVQGKAENLRKELVSTDQGQVSLEQIYKGTWGNATRGLFDFVESFRSKIPGGVDTLFRVNREKSKDLIRALYNEKSMDSSTGFASAYRTAREGLLKELERNGVPIALLKDYGAQMAYDGVKVMRKAPDEFVDFVLPRIDAEKMFHENGDKMSIEDIKTFLKEARAQIIEESRTGVFGRNLGKTANASREMHRRIHYTGSQAYIEVFEYIGKGNIFDNLIGQLDGLAMDVALTRKFGPRPKRVFDQINRQAEKTSIILDNQRIFNTASGITSGIANPRIASVSSAMRNLVTSAKLHSAVISALQDQAHIKGAARVWGVAYSKILGKQLKALFVPGSNMELRRTATQLGHVIDWSHGIQSAISRHSDVAAIDKLSNAAAGLADFTVRASGLARLTNVSKMSTYVSLLQHISESANKAWDQLDVRLRNGLQADGITSKDWDLVRAHTIEVDGITYLDFDAAPNEAAERFIGALAHEERLAIPEPGFEAKAVTTGGAAAGTAERELRAWATQFQTFGISMTLANWRRMLFHPSNVGHLNKVKFAAHMVIYSTLLGTLVQQLKDVKDGKEMRSWDDPGLWLNSALNIGIWGLGSVPLDTAAMASATSSGMLYSAAPPAIRLVFDIVSTGNSSLGHALEGSMGKAAYEAIDFAGKNLPPKLWYTELMMQRYIWDQLLRMADPEKAANSFRRKEKALMKRTGQKYKVRPL